MCGGLFLVGTEGIYHSKCDKCKQEDYVVNDTGNLICGSCLALSIESIKPGKRKKPGGSFGDGSYAL